MTNLIFVALTPVTVVEFASKSRGGQRADYQSAQGLVEANLSIATKALASLRKSKGNLASQATDGKGNSLPRPSELCLQKVAHKLRATDCQHPEDEKSGMRQHPGFLMRKTEVRLLLNDYLTGSACGSQGQRSLSPA